MRSQPTTQTPSNVSYSRSDTPRGAHKPVTRGPTAAHQERGTPSSPAAVSSPARVGSRPRRPGPTGRSGPSPDVPDALRRYSIMPFDDRTPEGARRMSLSLGPQVTEDVPLSLADRDGRRLSGREMLQDILDRRPAAAPAPAATKNREAARNPRGAA